MSNLNLNKICCVGLLLASVFVTGCGLAKAGLGKVFAELIEAGIKGAAKNGDSVLKGASRSSDNAFPALGRATIKGVSRSHDSARKSSH